MPKGISAVFINRLADRDGPKWVTFPQTPIYSQPYQTTYIRLLICKETLQKLDKLYMHKQVDLAGRPAPRTIGIDELSIRKGPTYQVVVSYLNRARLIWVRAGRKEADLDLFFQALGENKSARNELSLILTWYFPS